MKCKDILYNLIANARNRRLPTDVSPESNASVKIAVIKHFDCQLPVVFSNDKIYFPLHCGTATTSQKCSRDNTGNNIAAYNPYLNEMTGIYWIAKHYEEIGNPDYIGLNHYRRFLQWDDTLLRPDTIVATSVLFHRKVIDRLCFNISSANRDALLAKLRSHAAELDLADFDTYLNGHVMYAANMFIMPRNHFHRYFAFIEPIIHLFINMIDTDEIPLRDAPAPEKRLYGYLLEHLTSYWLWQEKHSGRSTIITTRVQNYEVSRNRA